MTKLSRTLAAVAALGLAAGTASYTAPASAREVVTVTTVRTAPPAPRFERPPPPRPGYVWAPGYWNWARGRYVWVGGHWYASRPGYVYHAPVWRPYGHGGWRIQRETWVRDPHWHH